jgi:hypothetical protein
MFSAFLPGLDNLALNSLTEQRLSYLVPGLILIGITLWFTCASAFTQRKLSVPFFGDEDGNSARAQQRWMTDAINLLREGLQKVLLPLIPVILYAYADGA